MKMHDIFMASFKELEEVLSPMTVYEYEQTLEKQKQSLLTRCRYDRNYIAHEEDFEDVVYITPKIQKFLDDLVYSLKIKKGILKDHMTSISKFGVANDTDTIIDVAQLLKTKKRNFTFVFNKNNECLGIITKDIISDTLCDGITKTTKVSKIIDKLEKVSFIEKEQSTPMVDLDKIKNKNIFVTNKTGKVIGFFII